MDKDFDTMLRQYDRFYKNMEQFKHYDDFDKLFIPSLDTAISGFYQKKFNEKLNDDIKKDDENFKKLKEEIEEKKNEEIDLQDDYIRCIKNNFIKIKNRQFKKKQQNEEKIKKSYIK
jgi:hypothetical protein